MRLPFMRSMLPSSVARLPFMRSMLPSSAARLPLRAKPETPRPNKKTLLQVFPRKILIFAVPYFQIPKKRTFQDRKIWREKRKYKYF